MNSDSFKIPETAEEVGGRIRWIVELLMFCDSVACYKCTRGYVGGAAARGEIPHSERNQLNTLTQLSASLNIEEPAEVVMADQNLRFLRLLL